MRERCEFEGGQSVSYTIRYSLNLRCGFRAAALLASCIALAVCAAVGWI